MAFQIIDIKSLKPDTYPVYFFDSNVWISYLKFTGSKGVRRDEEPYLEFFEALVNVNITSSSNPKLAGKFRNQPKIAVTSMMISEVINAYMRNVAMRLHFGEAQYKSRDFKRDYRITSDYLKQLNSLLSDFKAFRDYCVIYDDPTAQIDPYSLFSELDQDIDFNDLYFYYLLRHYKVPIVTNDRDFKFQDIPIITANPTLLKLK